MCLDEPGRATNFMSKSLHKHYTLFPLSLFNSPLKCFLVLCWHLLHTRSSFLLPCFNWTINYFFCVKINVLLRNLTIQQTGGNVTSTCRPSLHLFIRPTLYFYIDCWEWSYCLRKKRLCWTEAHKSSLMLTQNGPQITKLRFSNIGRSK